MPTPDLYATLGVDRAASAEEINRAYRKAAKDAHPDTGGTARQFALVKLARDTLGDDRRRAHYDATGEAEQPAPDTTEAKARAFAVQAVLMVIQKAASERVEIDEIDVITSAVDMMRGKLAELDTRIREMTVGASEIRGLAKRFKAKAGKQNLLRPMLENSAAEMERMISVHEKEREPTKLAIEMIKDHEFLVDPVAMMGAMLRGQAGSMFTWGP